MDHIPLPKNYRFKVSPGVFKGTVCIKLQKKGLIFWNTSSQSSYGMFKGQNLNEESILEIESKIWKEYKDMSNKKYGCRAIVDVKSLEYTYNWDYIVSSQISNILSELHNKVENPDFTTLNLTMSYNAREFLPVMDIIVEVETVNE